MSSILYLFAIFVLFVILCIGIFYILCHLIKIWTGCSTNEAVAKIHNFMNGKIEYKLCQDTNFEAEICESIQSIIGDNRFEKILRLNQLNISPPLLFFEDGNGRLPSIGVSVFYDDDNEKNMLANIITNIVRKYLQLYGWSTQVLIEWKTRPDLKMPYLYIRYARTAREQEIMKIELQNRRKKIISQHTPVLDETEGDDLCD